MSDVSAVSHPDGGVVLAPDGSPVAKRLIIAWEAGAFVFIMLAASALHFAYELSGFQIWATPFGSVNESTVEHLKLFFWPALIFAVVQNAYTRHRVNNFWWAKGLAFLVAPVVLVISFYFYLGISLPIYGRGFLWADIGTGALGVLTGNFVTYFIMTSPALGAIWRNLGVALAGLLAIHFVVATYNPPRMFLYEDFFRYNYAGKFGILDDYSAYLVFRTPEEYEALQAANALMGGLENN